MPRVRGGEDGNVSTESITGAELRAAIDRLGWYMQHEPGIPSSAHPADRIIRDVERHREPEYEPGEIYQSRTGFRYLRLPDESGTALPWLLLSKGGTVIERVEDVPDRPLCKLVPEEAPPASAAGDGPQEVVQPGEMYEDRIGQRFYRTVAISPEWLMLPEGTPVSEDCPAYPLRRLMTEGSPLADSERDLIRRDLGRLLDLLGLGAHARPASSHEVFVMCLEEVAKLAGDRKETCPGGC